MPFLGAANCRRGLPSASTFCVHPSVRGRTWRGFVVRTGVDSVMDQGYRRHLEIGRSV